MKEMSSASEPIGQNLIKIISNVCFSFFVFSVLIFTVIAITYQPPDPWLESSKALTRVFSSNLPNATFQTDDSVLKTGEDLIAISPTASSTITAQSIEKSLPQISGSICNDSNINCSDPRVLATIERFNLKVFKSIVFLDYQTPVAGSKPEECDVAWRFRNKKEKSWRRYRDFRRFTLAAGEDCNFEVTKAGRWHSGTNARQPRSDPANNGGVRVKVRDEDINDTIPSFGSESNFRKGRYLYYTRGGDYCKGMNHFLWSFLCGLGEAQYLNRTFVMDLSICLAATYNPSHKDEEGKDFRYYFDFEHLKEVASVVEEMEFLTEWKKLDKNRKKNRIPVRKVASYKVTPMQLKKDKSTVLWRQFDGPEPENYWYRVCEGKAAKYVQRPWHALWKSKRLMNIVSEISGRMDWDFDAVHVVRGEKAVNKELWPNLDGDTSPDALLEKLKQLIQPWRNLYIATNEPFYNYFDKLRSQFKIHLLDDFKELWGNKSEWYNETSILNNGKPVDFDGYMRVEVDTEVLYRAKTRVETFNNLTRDCKDGVNTC
ncbi:calcium ion binding protein [Tasmannia lanceolata]|uniref:calcium ion binding protein n=1 Tax=Tasmannia lanceolata TaxID=3420 RepID=UPI004064AD08